MSNGKDTLVDDEDFVLFSGVKWSFADGYAVRTVYEGGGRSHPIYTHHRLHRLILNARKGELVDHINGNKLDNRRCNLRLCSVRQNCQNRFAVVSKTGFKGVTKALWGKHIRWRARIRVDGSLIHLGYFQSPESAAKAYNDAANVYFGIFANINSPASPSRK